MVDNSRDDKNVKILKCLPARISLIILEGIKLLNFEMNACKIDNSLIILETITIVKILKYPSARISLIFLETIITVNILKYPPARKSLIILDDKNVKILKFSPARKSLIILETIKIVKILKCPPARIWLIILEGIKTF